ncbi:MAG TPA: alginate lyase family protein [Ferruginibacter sp.]|nr:alginate lyase family protein [Ferruginibacter sp.]
MNTVKNILLLFILATQYNLTIAAQPGVFAIDAKALLKNKAGIQSKDVSVTPAYKQLLKDADKALEFGPVSVMEKKNVPPSGDKHDYMSLAPYYWPDPNKPNGLPYIRKDGETNPEVKDYKDKEYMPKLCELANTLALAYYFSGEEKYAAHAAKLLKVWFLDKDTRMNPNLNYGQAMKGHNTGRGAGLIDTRHFIKVPDAIGLLQGSKYWTAADQEGMIKWFSDFLNWMQTSKNGIDEMNAKNNHGDWYDAQRLSFALFTGNTELAKQIVLNAQSRLDEQVDDAGMFPLEMERTTSLHYSVFAMEAFFLIAKMGEGTGIDLWHHVTPSGRSLERSFTALKPFFSKEKDWEGKQIKEYNHEEGYVLLMEGSRHFNCKDCVAVVQHLAADKAPRLRINLLY